MSDKPKTAPDTDFPEKRPKLPEGWEQLELPMTNGHSRVITRKRQPR